MNKSFSEKLSSIGVLMRSTFQLIWLGGPELKKPTLKAVYFSVFTTALFFTAILLPFFMGINGVLIGVVLFALWIIFRIYGVFLYARCKADQSLMVYQALIGAPVTYAEAHMQNDQVAGNIRTIAFVDVLVSGASASAMNGNENRGLIKGMIISIFFFVLNEVWDLVSNYLLPAVSIEKKSIKEVIPLLKLIKNNIPATLAGVFGVDFVGSAISSLFAMIFGVGIFLSAGIGFLLPSFVEYGTISASTPFNVVPLVIAVVLISLFQSAYSKIVASIKTIYFSCFYTTLAHGEMIREEYKQNIEAYLNFKETPTV